MGAIAIDDGVFDEVGDEQVDLRRIADKLRDRPDRRAHVLSTCLCKVAEAALNKAGITVNKNSIPGDPEKYTITSGVRLGSPAGTTRGFGVAEFRQVGHLIADVLDAPKDEARIAQVRAKVAELTRAFIAQVERVNPKVNAIVTFTPERALRQAKALDAKLARRKQ